MKILYVVKNLRLANGVASYIMNYYNNLKKENIRMDFLIISDVGSPYYEKIIKDGNKIFCLPSYKKNIIKTIKYLKDLLKDGKYDVVHCNTINSGSLVLKIAKQMNVPVRILHSHATQNGDSKVKEMIGKILKKIAIKNANEYVACSKLAGDMIFENEKYDIIRNAIDIEKYSYNEECRKRIREKEDIEDDKIIMTVGRITKQKNPFFIVDIMEELLKRDESYKLYWFGNGNLDNEVKEYARARKINNKIIFFGASQQVNEYYSVADIFILPSLFEGLPVVGIEAQASGIPVIFSEKITKEAKISERTMFLPINDKKIWADEIQKIFEKYKENDRKNVMIDNEYDIKKEYIKLIKKYESLIEKNEVENLNV